MLQIVQGMYFRNVPLTDTLHRGVLYTNLRSFGTQVAHDLLFGRLLPSTSYEGVGSLTIEAREHLETVTESGRREVLVATSGDQLIDEIAAVTAFCLNAVCTRDYSRALRLIPRIGDSPATRGPASIMRRTFDPVVVLSEQSINDLNAFLCALTALQRKNYEAAIRAIRQIVEAVLVVGEDATLAYTLMVAALESLSQSTKPPLSNWSEYDEQKRGRIEEATRGLSARRKDKIQAAILANEHQALKHRFVSFVLDHVEPSFYRDEAIDAVRPIAAVELPRALHQAYDIRSRNIHALQNLAPEMWMAAYQADTAYTPRGVLLGLEGLARLARHVVRRFIARAPCGKDSSFNYRTALPGIVRVPLAAEHWIHNAAGFNRKTAPRFLNAMIELLVETKANGGDRKLVDMTAVVVDIEKRALRLSKHGDRLPMAAIMTIWNAFAPKEYCRELNPKLREIFERDLDELSIVSFAVRLLLGNEMPWPLKSLQALASDRRNANRQIGFQPMPKRIDAALYLIVAGQLFLNGDNEGGLNELCRAVETVPGLADLIKYEESIKRGYHQTIDMTRFVFGETEFVEWNSPGNNASQSGGDVQLSAQ